MYHILVKYFYYYYYWPPPWPRPARSVTEAAHGRNLRALEERLKLEYYICTGTHRHRSSHSLAQKRIVTRTQQTLAQNSHMVQNKSILQTSVASRGGGVAKTWVSVQGCGHTTGQAPMRASKRKTRPRPISSKSLVRIIILPDLLAFLAARSGGRLPVFSGRMALPSGLAF